MKPLATLLVKSIATCLLIASATTTTWAEDIEPSIIIRHSEDKTFYEYTVNGEVVEIKVVPKEGPAYYLIPAGGEDQEFKRQSQSKLVVPKWVIFRW